VNSLNTPFWESTPKPERQLEHQKGAHSKSGRMHQEVWYLKLNDPGSQWALWLRFTLLVTANGFKQVAETWSIFSQRMPSREVRKVAAKQTFPIQEFKAEAGVGFKIAHSEFTDSHTRGQIQSKGNTIEWDFTIRERNPLHVEYVPEILSKLKLVKNRVITPGEDLVFNGTLRINGEQIQVTEAMGMQGHLAGPKNGHSWVWAHCNAFLNEQGRPASFVFEGLTARARLVGSVALPPISALFFWYQGKSYTFNRLRDSLSIRSEANLTEWNFQADRGELRFKGSCKAEHKDFTGVTYEDTDGSLLFCSNSKLSDMTILVYRQGKLESTFTAPGTAAFEVVSREKNPYVPFLI